MQDYEEDYSDMETMRFVNPYEVNPIANTGPQASSIRQQQVSVNPDDILSQKGDVTQNQLRMEEFSDLSALLMGGNVEFTGSTDELNTPVFDKEAFNFPQQSKPINTGKTKSNLKIKVEAQQHYSYGDNSHLDLNLNQVQPQENYIVMEAGNEDSSMYLYQPFAHSLHNQDRLKDAYSPPSEGIVFLQDIAAFNEPSSFTSTLSLNNNFNSTATSPQDDRYSYISSPVDLQIDPSVSAQHDHCYNSHQLKLNLMAEQFKFPIKEEALSTLNTPDVIDGVVQMGTDFNILDLVNNEDITVLSADEEFVSTLTSPTAFKSEPSTPSTVTSQTSSPRRMKKRKSFGDADDDDDEDDEDYVPPPYKKPTTSCRLANDDLENSDSDDSLYHPNKSRRRRSSVSKSRGRPPKRVDSVSSEGSKDHDVSKYRELRDKNNEASRKSRLKKKVKEQEYEKEADDLYAKNIRLKAQVDELEKMVNTFRSNLFKILVTK